MFETLLDVAEIAERLGVSKSLIYKMVDTKEIPHYRIGNAIRFDIDEIEKWAGQSHWTIQAPQRCESCD
jgi:excisionase family DNA binding protein